MQSMNQASRKIGRRNALAVEQDYFAPDDEFYCNPPQRNNTSTKSVVTPIKKRSFAAQLKNFIQKRM